jgi:hypothetical protein
MFKVILHRRVVLCALVACASVLSVGVTTAQQSFPSPTANDSLKYLSIFRRAAAFQASASSETSRDGFKSSFDRGLARSLNLTSDDYATLQSLAVRCTAEIKPIEGQIRQALVEFRNSYPNGHVPAGIRPSAPPQLAALQVQENAVIAKYVASLKQSIGDEKFSMVQQKLRNMMSIQAAAN